MQRITYLLGAGASANALPLIKKTSGINGPGLPQELKNFIEKHTSSFLTSNVGWNDVEIKSLNEIADKCIEFGTPDLYAKYLLETADDYNYKLLKNLLSLYFKYKQEINECFDFRALTFLTTISQNKKIPENVKILTWNYDSQIEIAAKKLKPVNNKVYDKLQGFTCWPNTRDGYDTSENPFLIHLNGVAGMHYSERNFYDKIETHFSFKSVQDKESLLSFAWEDENNTSKKIFNEQRFVVACEMAANTDILVVIGYSFPFFNRKIDGLLFNSMSKSLKKIYFQDPNSDGSQLKSQFNLSPQANSSIIHISQVENYHIPFEL